MLNRGMRHERDVRQRFWEGSRGSRDSPQKIQHDAADDDEVLRGIFGVDAEAVFSECDIELPVEPILDGPMLSGPLQRAGSASRPHRVGPTVWPLL